MLKNKPNPKRASFQHMLLRFEEHSLGDALSFSHTADVMLQPGHQRGPDMGRVKLCPHSLTQCLVL